MWWALDHIHAVLSYSALAMLALVNAALQDVQGLPITVLPTINLVAVLGAAVAVGMMFQRVRDLERRIRDLEQGHRESNEK